VGDLSVADTEDRLISVLQDGARRGCAAQTKRKHKAAAQNARCSSERRNDMDWALKDIPMYLESSQIYNICLRSNKSNTAISQFEIYKYGISNGYPRDIF
jgi:hypothetical protein